MTDPISDMLISLKNAQKSSKKIALFSFSKFKNEILKVLEKEKIIQKVERKGKGIHKMIEVEMPEENGINGIKLLSKPSRRLYSPYGKLIRSKRGGIILITTTKGVMTTSQARKEGVGGQLIAEIW